MTETKTESPSAGASKPRKRETDPIKAKAAFLTAMSEYRTAVDGIPVDIRARIEELLLADEERKRRLNRGV